MKDIVTKNQKETVQTFYKTIKRCKKTFSLSNVEIQKMYRLVYDKRVLNENLSSVPFGF